MITMDSTMKPYAESTLIRKYKGIGLPDETLEKFHAFVNACAYFYLLIDIEHL